MSKLKTLFMSLLRRVVFYLFKIPFVRRLYKSTIPPTVNALFMEQLLAKTNDFANTTWLGKPIWQNTLDLWVIQETIWEVQPELLIECGTNRGGSAYYFAQLFDLMGKGRVLTIDIEKMHDLSHPRIDFVIGDSASEAIVEKTRQAVASANGPVMVILDSDHSASHVRKELEAYSSYVSPGSFVLVQDGLVDVLSLWPSARPGPLVAIKDFLETHPEFEVDTERCEKFLISHHPMGWLRRKELTASSSQS